MTRGRPLLALLALLACGCTVYDVSTRYASALDGRDWDKLDAPWDVWVQPRPETRFTMVGVLGVPLVPVELKVTPRKQILLWAQLHVLEGREFSLAWRPCLEV